MTCWVSFVNSGVFRFDWLIHSCFFVSNLVCFDFLMVCDFKVFVVCRLTFGVSFEFVEYLVSALCTAGCNVCLDPAIFQSLCVATCCLFEDVF